MFGRRTSLIIIALIWLLCGVALSMCSYLMQLHAPITSSNAQAAEKNSYWGEVCSGDDPEPGQKDTVDCRQVVTDPQYGYVILFWPKTTHEFVKNEVGEIEERATTAWFSPYKVPVAQLAMIFYFFLFGWFFFVGVPERHTRGWLLVPLFAAFCSLIAAVYFIWVMADQDKWCPICMRLHVVDLCIFVLLVLLWPLRRERVGDGGVSQSARAETRGSEIPAGESRGVGYGRGGVSFWKLVVAGVTLPAAIMASSFIYRDGQLERAQLLMQQQSTLQFVWRSYQTAEPVNIPPRPTQVSIGSPQARLELVMFTDLQCPVCIRFEMQLKEKLQPMFKDQLRVTFRHFPICTDCNVKSKRNLHPNACDAAYAVEAARLQQGSKGYLAMHDLIATPSMNEELNKRRWEPADWEKLASRAGLDVARFRIDFAGEEVRQIVLGDIELARQIGVRSTPTLYLNGRPVDALARGMDDFWLTIARAALRSNQQPASQPTLGPTVDDAGQ
ncbi:MAG: hypothetical protein HJJLKODD_02496 [Phycisphaerae bacterium]|nr:hypothetical protein [Phycisphaerae bacterium]